MENDVLDLHNGEYVPSFKGAEGLKILPAAQCNHFSPQESYWYWYKLKSTFLIRLRLDYVQYALLHASGHLRHIIVCPILVCHLRKRPAVAIFDPI